MKISLQGPRNSIETFRRRVALVNRFISWDMDIRVETSENVELVAIGEIGKVSVAYRSSCDDGLSFWKVGGGRLSTVNERSGVVELD